MIPAKVKVYPRGGPVQLPPPGRHALLSHSILLIDRGPSPVGPKPYAAPLRMHLAHAVPAAAAGAVSGMLRTLGLRAEKGQVLDPTVTALLAGKQDLFGHTLKGP